MNVSSWHTSPGPEKISGRKAREHKKLKWTQWTFGILLTLLGVGVFPKKGESLRGAVEAEKGDGKYHFLSEQRKYFKKQHKGSMERSRQFPRSEPHNPR